MNAPQAATRLSACRVCGNTELEPILDLGDQYLSSVFPESLEYRATAPRYPLDLVMCVKRQDSCCGLPQLGHRTDLSSMYDDYPYSSATNSSMAGILKDVADSGRAAVQPAPGDTILDIGGNDGTLLSYFSGAGCKLVNIDPASNVEAAHDLPEYERLAAFFSTDAFASVSAVRAKLIFSVAMFYHLDDPVSFAQEVSQCLAKDGVWVIQMAYLPAMLRTNMYDNIVHEHVGYYATEHIRWVLDKAGLEVFDVTLNDVYGGSFRVFARHAGSGTSSASRLARVLEDEHGMALSDRSTYRAFEERVERTRSHLRRVCDEAAAAGRSIWVYGASTKGNTILQYCGVGSKQVTAAADANPFKVGKYIIGGDIPIETEEAMRAARPDLLLALPYSFVDAFVEREADLVADGTRFVVPLPEVRLVP
jgi:NDP-4-keto-2,6-dideoxyhexose 3-C-methyltransferase